MELAPAGIATLRKIWHDNLMNSVRPQPRLIIVCGLPGSGKTTHSKRLAEQIRAIRFCADEWLDALSIDHYDEKGRHKVEALLWENAQELLLHGVPVIIEWGTWSRKHRDALRLRAREMGAAVELHYLTATFDVLLDRVRLRRRERSPITRERLLEWRKKFEAPDSQEMALYDKGFRAGGNTPEPFANGPSLRTIFQNLRYFRRT